MIELLVVLAIIAVLILILLMTFGSPLSRAKDARTKKNIHQLKIAFEEYYNDNYCYPPAEWFDAVDDCNSDQFSPYINRIKCDPKTNLPYFIEYDDTGCDWFKIYTNLYYAEEQLCTRYGGEIEGFNFGTSATNTEIALYCPSFVSPQPSPSSSPSPTPSPTPTPTPTPSPSPSPTPSQPLPGEGDYYCQAIDNCTWYDNTTWTCTPNYTTSNCDTECSWRTGACVHD